MVCGLMPVMISASIWEQIKTMLAASPVEDSEEHAIHDYERFGGYALSEYEGIETAHEAGLFHCRVSGFRW